MATTTARPSRPSERRGEAAGRPPVWAWIMGLALIALTGFVVAWAGGWIRFGTDPRVAEILALQEQARDRFATAGGPSNPVEAAGMIAAMGEIRQRTEALPEHLRPEVERSAGQMFQNAFRARMDAYFALPPEKRQAEIDRQIDQEEMMRKAFETGRSLVSALGGGQGQGASGQSGTGQAAAGQGGAGGGGPPGPGGSNWGSRSEDDRNRWRKSMIDRTIPEERARYTEYRRAMDARRLQRGLPSTGPR